MRRLIRDEVDLTVALHMLRPWGACTVVGCGGLCKRMLPAARDSAWPDDFAPGGDAWAARSTELRSHQRHHRRPREEHGHRVLTVHGKGDKTALVPLPPAVNRALERAINGRSSWPIPRTRRGTRTHRHCATRRLSRLATTAGVTSARMHPHMLRHTFVTTMLDAGVDLRDVQIAARHADPRTTMRYDRAREESRGRPSSGRRSSA
jgi:integrase